MGSENKEKVLHKVIPTKNFIKNKKVKTIDDLKKETIKYKTPQIQNNVFKKKSFMELESLIEDNENKKPENPKAKINSEQKSEGAKKVMHKVTPTRNYNIKNKAKTHEELNKDASKKWKTPQIKNHVFPKKSLKSFMELEALIEENEDKKTEDAKKTEKAKVDSKKNMKKETKEKKSAPAPAKPAKKKKKKKKNLPPPPQTPKKKKKKKKKKK